MKLFAVVGSPHKHGNTVTLLDKVLAGARSVGIEASCADLYPLSINPCRGCDACKRNEDGGCVQKDGMQDLYPHVLEADILVWASPMYWWNVTAPLKAFIDRLYGLPKNSLKGKSLLLLMTTQAAPDEDGRQGLELLLQEICNYADMSYLGAITASSDPTPVKEQPQTLEAAFKRGAALRSA